MAFPSLRGKQRDCSVHTLNMTKTTTKLCSTSECLYYTEMNTELRIYERDSVIPLHDSFFGIIMFFFHFIFLLLSRVLVKLSRNQNHSISVILFLLRSEFVGSSSNLTLNWSFFFPSPDNFLRLFDFVSYSWLFWH